MDAQLANELASRLVSGDELTPAEEQDLLRWLENHPEAREALLEDEAIDNLLRCWTRLDDTADGFVHSALRRLSERQVQPRDISSPAAAAVAVPPPVIHSLKTPPRAGWRRKFIAVAAGRWAAVVACSCALLLVGTIGSWWLARGSRTVVANRPPAGGQDVLRPGLAGINDSRQEPERAFATLAQSTGAVWDPPRTVGDRLAADVLKLTEGKAELHFDSGTVVLLTGPAALELCRADEVSLRRGSLTARVPAQAVGFAVVTPVSRIVDLGTEFDVVVDERGATQTLVRRGKVSLRAQRGIEQPGKPIELAAGALDLAAISVPDIAASLLPVTTVARGGGRFLGMVSVDGDTVEFHSPEALGEFQALVMKQLRNTPVRFGQQWRGLVEASRQGAKASAKTTPEQHPSETIGAVDRNPATKTFVAGGADASAHAGPGGQTVEVKEKEKTISITDSKESGITVTVTEMVDGKKKVTQVNAATAAELAGKNPDAHRWYRKYLHPKPKAGKVK